MQNEPAAHRQAMLALGMLIRETRDERPVEAIVNLISKASPSVRCSPDWYRNLEGGARRAVAAYELRAVACGLVADEAGRRALYGRMRELVFPGW